MYCPFCQGEMETGFLEAGAKLRWVKKKSRFSRFWSLQKGDVALTSLPVFQIHLPAYICKSCRKVLVDYTGQNARER